jgi:molybdate transport system substrate-binding protein
MKSARDKQLAEDYVDFILSQEVQGFFETAGFIPATSEEGLRMTQELGM